MANRPAAVRIFLYGLATFFTFTTVYLCGFRLTGTLTYTAMLMLMNSTTARLRKKYVFQRCIGQILGLSCGWSLYYGIGYALSLLILPTDYYQNFLECSKRLSDLIEQTKYPDSTSIETMRQLHLQQKNEIEWLCDDISPFKMYTKISNEVLQSYHFLVKANGLWVDFLSSYAMLEKRLSKSFENEVKEAVRFLQPLHAQASNPKQPGKWPILKNQFCLPTECHEDRIVSGELSKYICLISQKEENQDVENLC